VVWISQDGYWIYVYGWSAAPEREDAFVLGGYIRVNAARLVTAGKNPKITGLELVDMKTGEVVPSRNSRALQYSGDLDLKTFLALLKINDNPAADGKAVDYWIEDIVAGDYMLRFTATYPETGEEQEFEVRLKRENFQLRRPSDVLTVEAWSGHEECGSETNNLTFEGATFDFWFKPSMNEARRFEINGIDYVSVTAPHTFRIEVSGDAGAIEELTVHSIAIETGDGERTEIADPNGKLWGIGKKEMLRSDVETFGIFHEFVSPVPYEYKQDAKLTVTADVSVSLREGEKGYGIKRGSVSKQYCAVRWKAIKAGSARGSSAGGDALAVIFDVVYVIGEILKALGEIANAFSN
jgi:hypothetical protein